MRSRASIDDKVKSSILRSPRGELRVDAYLDDLEINVKNLKSRFDKSYSASSEAETVLRQSSIIDGFVKSSGQGMKGASEWDALVIDLRRLAGAYSTTFPLAPTGGTVRRINDAEAGAAADDMKSQAKKMRDSIDANAGLPKDVRDSVKANLHALEEQADLVKSRMNSGQPASAEMRKLLDQVSAVDKFMAANKVMPADAGRLAESARAARQAEAGLRRQGAGAPAIRQDPRRTDAAPGLAGIGARLGTARRWRHADSRNRKVELGAAVCSVHSPDLSAVTLHDRAGNRQSHPHAARLGGVERLEQTAFCTRRQSGTVVAHDDVHEMSAAQRR